MNLSYTKLNFYITVKYLVYQTIVVVFYITVWVCSRITCTWFCKAIGFIWGNCLYAPSVYEKFTDGLFYCDPMLLDALRPSTTSFLNIIDYLWAGGEDYLLIWIGDSLLTGEDSTTIWGPCRTIIGVVGFLSKYVWIWGPVCMTWCWACWFCWITWTFRGYWLLLNDGMLGLWGLMEYDWFVGDAVGWFGRTLFGIWIKKFWFMEDLIDCCWFEGVEGKLLLTNERERLEDSYWYLWFCSFEKYLLGFGLDGIILPCIYWPDWSVFGIDIWEFKAYIFELFDEICLFWAFIFWFCCSGCLTYTFW